MAQMKRKTDIRKHAKRRQKRKRLGAPAVNASSPRTAQEFGHDPAFAHSYRVARIPPNLGCSVCFVGSNPLLLEPAAICVIRGQNIRLRRSRAV